MPPKKSAAAAKAEHGDGEGDKFRWTPENDRRLLILALRGNVTGADYHEFVKAMPAGASFQGVRQRLGKLRREQQQIYEDMGWTLPDGKATASISISNGANNNNDGDDAEKPAKSKGKAGRKRKATDADADDKPSKKAAKKSKVKDAIDDDEEEGPNDGLHFREKYTEI
ncbi:hypothetical protein BU26DRAFT_234765 [Trematosphaeria pertusa]|uniref:Myb-like domain-containing protein n=1 Tax=Trematosphaeria pertusa TaxID=390896 RepID=A0A6A6IWR0_9PLEO|nr:uncharacterized protein BU26DRAFT_234765 [Trematosphaeria pertusa]KAF2254060.1 hypothetical protein BU26DRAFT_234765 [Trematosphaeria pertusa]